MKKLYTQIILSLICFQAFAQTALVKGKVVDAANLNPLFEATVLMPEFKILTTTKGDGSFSFSNIPYGSHDIIISYNNGQELTKNISVNSNVVDLAAFEYEVVDVKSNTMLADNSAISGEDASSEDENTSTSSGQNISSVLSSSNDVFLRAATFGWGGFFFRPRGYENNQNVLFLNGVPMNDLEEGGVFFNSWGGLNDVFRSRSMTYGLAPNDFTFGGLGLNTVLDASASTQRKQTRVTYSLSNRNYRNRLMLTHSSGLNKKGWAYSLSFSKRWSQTAPVPGVFYDAYGYFGAIEKRFKNQGLSLMMVGAPIRRGKQGPATAEMFDLAGTNYYNPNWGYQKGVVRNSRVFSTHTPLFILSHDIKIKSNTLINSAISYQSGETSTTSLDWYNSENPKPDYYRYMPSYQDSADDRAAMTSMIKSNPEKYLQIDWDRMYQANYFNKSIGQRALYILAADVEQMRRFNANLNIQTVVNPNITIHGGLNYQNQNNHNFKRIDDLLGGGFWKNTNQFAERISSGNTSIVEFDLNNPNQILKEGDTYNYDYNVHFKKAQLFGQGVFTYNKVDFFGGAEINQTNFHRVGNYKSGLYPSNSFGISEKQSFTTGRVKGGVTYKLNGRNYFYANGAFGTQAPFVDNVFISPRTRNAIIANPTVEKMASMEAGYMMRSPNVKGRFTFYATDIKNSMDISRFYFDDGFSFANMTLTGVDKRYTGIEAGSEIKLNTTMSLNLTASYGQAFYTSRPVTSIFIDNDTTQSQSNTRNDTAYIKNYFIGTGPQTALQASLFYRSPKFWYGSITANYLGRSFISIAPTSRTKESIDILDRTSEKFKTLVNQEQYNSFVTVDLFFGKSYKVNKFIPKASNQTFAYFNLGISNLLNNRNIKLYGFENLRANGESENLQ
ncbi:MAG: TonB-dependent receptor, partial [Chitinophagaceae bacterium]|nr:TonB-dependent receptor [Chitinophagaceae bacterium]